MTRRIPFDYWLFVITFVLVLVGIVMVFSSSSIYALQNFGDSYYFLKKQIPMDYFFCVQRWKHF